MERIRETGNWAYCCAIGQDSHRFVTDQEWTKQPHRPLVLAGVSLAGERPLAANSDGDVILHALTNALSGVTGQNVLGERADRLCLGQGICDSSAYLRLALDDLATCGWQLAHVSVAVEAARPKLAARIEQMRGHLAELSGLEPGQIGLTATSGEGLTAFGRGEGIQVFCQVTVRRPDRQRLP
jgi:2-C-methyl-D-erythritol 2,4-cyclodiphosphate synthase